MNEHRTHSADSAIDDEMPEIRGRDVTFVSHDEFVFPAETVELVRKAIGASKARDDEGEFPTLWDHLDYSGENKAVTVTRQAALDALAALGRESLIDPRLACAAKDGEQSLSLDMQKECVSLRVALATARDQFKDYERQHLAKGTMDGNNKAYTNRNMAAMCQAAIDGSRRVVPSVDPEPGNAGATIHTIRAAVAGGMLDGSAYDPVRASFEQDCG